MAKMEITIGGSMQKKTAGQVRIILSKRYKGKEKEIDACIKKHFDKDEGAEKLNATNGNANTAKSESKDSPK